MPENHPLDSRIEVLKEKMLSAPRFASIEQARIITRIYQENEELSVPKKRALSLKAALEELEIGVEPEEETGQKASATASCFPNRAAPGSTGNLKRCPPGPRTAFL